jgi:hypothetical protein
VSDLIFLFNKYIVLNAVADMPVVRINYFRGNSFVDFSAATTHQVKTQVSVRTPFQ